MTESRAAALVHRFDGFDVRPNGFVDAVNWVHYCQPRVLLKDDARAFGLGANSNIFIRQITLNDPDHVRHVRDFGPHDCHCLRLQNDRSAAIAGEYGGIEQECVCLSVEKVANPCNGPSTNDDEVPLLTSKP